MTDYGAELQVQVPAPVHAVAPGPVPTISIVVAAYNAAEFLGEALESTRRQTAPPREVVVCDDGSTDDIDRALHPFADEVIVVKQPNRGESAAKNAAVRAASGDFVAILDADDVDLPERLARIGHLAALRPDLDVISTDCWLVRHGELERRYHHDGHPYETADQRRRILERNFIYNPAVRRTTWLEVGGFDERITEPVADWECWQRIILGGGAAGLVDEPLTLYRQRAGQLTADRLSLYRGRVRVIEASLRRSDLAPHEREAALAALRNSRRRLLDESVRVGAPSTRTTALAVVRDPQQPRRSRAGALAAAVSPTLTRWAQLR